jgi:Spy/CpxP family protein refolding chaperone
VQADELPDVRLILYNQHANGGGRHIVAPRVIDLSQIHHVLVTQAPSNEDRTHGRQSAADFWRTVMTLTAKRIGFGIGAVALAAMVSGFGYQNISAQGPGAGGGGRLGGPGRGFGGPGGPGMGRRGGPGGPGGGGLAPMMLERLDLTADQRDRVRQIMDSHRDEQRALGDRAQQAHQALQEAVTTTFNESAIRARSADVAAVDADMAVAQARIYGEVLQILTADQQEKLKKLQADMKQRQEQMRERRQQNGGRRQL